MGNVDKTKFDNKTTDLKLSQKSVTSSTSSGINTGTIPVGKQQTTVEDKYSKLVTSEEFLALSNEEKLEKLKAEFPNVEEATLKVLLNDIITTLDAQEAPVELTTETQVTSEDEALTNEYADTYGYNSIDDLLADLKTKPKKQLTDVEKKILEFFGDGNNKNLQAVLQDVSQFSKQIDELIPEEIIKSEAWQNKTPEEKLNLRIDALLTKMISGYENYSDENKENFRKSITDKFMEKVAPELSSDASKALSYQLAAQLFDKMEKSGITMESISKMTDEQKHTMLMQGVGDFIDKYFVDSDINVDELEKLKPEEQLDKIAETILKNLNPYMTQSELDSAKDDFINIIGSHFYGSEWTSDNIKVLSGNLATKMLAIMEYRKEYPNGDKTSEILTDFSKYAVVLENYDKNHGIQLSDGEKVRREALKANGGELTNAGYLSHLENKIKNNNATDAEKAEYKRLSDIKSSFDDTANSYKKTIQELTEKQKTGKLTKEEKLRLKKAQDYVKNKYPKLIQEFNETKVQDPADTVSYYIKTTYKDLKTPEEQIDAYLKDSNIDINKLDHEQRSLLLVKLKDNNDLLKALGHKFGLSDEEIYSTINENVTKDSISKIADAEKRAREQGIAANVSDETQRVGHRHWVVRTNKDDPDNLSIALKTAMQGTYAEENAKQLPATMLDLGVSKENIIKVSTTALNSENIKDGTKALYTDSLLENAKSDSDRLDYCKAISQNVNNAVVLEVLASGSKYIQDENIKTQYNTTVETASKNYPPEVQERVKTAMETGQVSTSQTTTTNKTETSESSQSSNKSTSTKTAPETVTKNTTGIANSTPSTNTSSTNSSTVVSNENNTYQSFKNNDTTYENLVAQKNAVLENITNTKEKIQTEIKKSESKEADITKAELDEVEEVLETENPTDEQVEKIKAFVSAHSVETIYAKIIEKFGSGVVDKMIDVITTYGSHDKILALANVLRGDKSRLVALYNRHPASEILTMLPSNVIKSLIPEISDLSTLSPTLIYEYLLDNRNNLTVDDLAKYLKYLPYEMQTAICNVYNEQNGTVSAVDNTYMTAMENQAQGKTENQDKTGNNNKVAKNSHTSKPKKTTSSKKEQAPTVAASQFTLNKKPQVEANEKSSDEITLDTGLTKTQQERDVGLSNEIPEDELGEGLQSTKVSNWKLKKPYLA